MLSASKNYFYASVRASGKRPLKLKRSSHFKVFTGFNGFYKLYVIQLVKAVEAGGRLRKKPIQAPQRALYNKRPALSYHIFARKQRSVVSFKRPLCPSFTGIILNSKMKNKYLLRFSQESNNEKIYIKTLKLNTSL